MIAPVRPKPLFVPISLSSSSPNIRRCQVVEFLEQFRFATTEQIVSLFFPFPSGAKKCQERMRRYDKDGLIKTKRLGRENVYYRGKWSQQYSHHLGITHAYIAVKKELEVYYTFEYYLEYKLTPEIRTDLFFIARNRFTGEVTLIAVEVDRATNPLKPKLEKYLNTFLSDTWLNTTWANLSGDKYLFPKIFLFSNRENIWKPKELNIKVFKKGDTP